MTLQMILTAQKLAQSLNVPAPLAQASAARSLRGIAPLESAGPEEIGFLADAKLFEEAVVSRAGLLLCHAREADLLTRRIAESADPNRVALPVPNVWAAVIHVLKFFHPEPEAEGDIHRLALVDETAKLNDPINIGPWTEVHEGVVIEANCVIGSRCHIGARTKIGPGCRIAPGVYIHNDTEIGARCRIGPGVIIGSDGFKYEKINGRSTHVPQVGRVVLEDDVDIGANTTIDRAGFAETRIGARTKIDNLVQIGHNVIVGPDCILCAQAGIAGSTKLGRGVIMAGQAGFKDHLNIADGTILLGQAGAAKDIAEPGKTWFGSPCEPSREWFRKNALLGQLGDMKKTLKALAEKKGSA